jgi:hypothetical protein
MFPEPVSAVGFVLGCISFLLSSLPSIYQKKRQISQCKEFLENFERQFRNIQGKYEGWRKVWGGLPEEKYRQAWGLNNIVRVQGWIKAIHDHFQQIGEEIRGPQPAQFRRVVERLRRNGVRQGADLPTPSDFEWWTGLIERIRNRSPVVVDENVRNAGIPYRIAFAFFRNDVLKTNLDNLARTVDDLDKFTTHEYWKLRWSYTKGTPTQSEVNRSLNLQDIRSEYTDFASLLYKRQKIKNEELGDLRSRQWSLELRLPDLTGDSSDIDSLGRIGLDFCLADRSSRPPDLKRATILYTPSDATASQSALSLRIDRTLDQLYLKFRGGNWNGPCRARDEGFKSLVSARRRSVPLRTLFERNIFHDEEMLKASAFDQAKLPVGLVNWTLLLWLTDWTSEPCCCRIRLHQLERSVITFTMSTEDHACDRGTQQESKIISLGVALTEILLGTPVRVRPPLPDRPDILGLGYNRAVPWQIQKREPGLLGFGVKWEPVKLNQILQDIKEKLDLIGASHSLVEAIGFCLNNPTFSPEQEFPIEAFQECATKVLTP